MGRPDQYSSRAAFLRRLLSRYQGRVDLALSYYNGGSESATYRTPGYTGYAKIRSEGAALAASIARRYIQGSYHDGIRLGGGAFN